MTYAYNRAHAVGTRSHHTRIGTINAVTSSPGREQVSLLKGCQGGQRSLPQAASKGALSSYTCLHHTSRQATATIGDRLDCTQLTAPHLSSRCRAVHAHHTGCSQAASHHTHQPVSQQRHVPPCTPYPHMHTHTHTHHMPAATVSQSQLACRALQREQTEHERSSHVQRTVLHT